MDDGRFDRLTKAVATGASRRSLLKGLLGTGGAALAGGAIVQPEADAARRPAPRPPRCPGRQIPSNGQCICPGDAPHKCGSDCCTDAPGDPPAPNHSECCDNACCQGTCYGEELCCPTNPGPGETPPLAHYCPGGGGSPDLCCQNGTHCCGAGTSENACVDVSTGGCCSAGDCGPLEEGACRWECSAGSCVSVYCVEGTICCGGDCRSTSEVFSCASDPEGCCDGFTEMCCGSDGCCLTGLCNQQDWLCCAAGEKVCSTGDNACCSASEECCGGVTCCASDKCATLGTCCTGDDFACEFDCCPADRCRTGQGCCPVDTIACGSSCCPVATQFCNAQGACECLSGTEFCAGVCCATGQCNSEGDCCVPDTTPCGADCCNDATQTCNGDICECKSGLILCDGACIAAQCCNSDVAGCTHLGYDLDCVACSSGECVTSGLDFHSCGTATNSWCSGGQCLDCIPYLNYGCTYDNQCCNGSCLGGRCDTQ